MITFKVPEQVLSLDEAEMFVVEFSDMIEKVKRSMMRSIQLIDGAYVNRKSIYDFFRQSLPDDGYVRNRAGKLFSELVRSSMPRYARQTAPLPLRVLCGACMLLLNESGETCEVRRRWEGHRHYVNDRDYLIDVRSLREYEDQFMPGGTYALTDKKLQDFVLLMQVLKGE